MNLCKTLLIKYKNKGWRCVLGAEQPIKSAQRKVAFRVLTVLPALYTIIIRGRELSKHQIDNQ